MPGSATEICNFARALLDGRVMPDTEPIWEDGTTITEEERHTVLQVMIYEARLRGERARQENARPARLRALRLLRRYLTPEQRKQLTDRRYFVVAAPSGRHYRFTPCTRTCHELEQHGKRWYAVKHFCLHPPTDDPVPLPHADVTLSQLLFLSADEEEFRKTANITDYRSQFLWNGTWLRRLNQTRRERQEGVSR